MCINSYRKKILKLDIVIMENYIPASEDQKFST